jgi:hypothetical protein
MTMPKQSNLFIPLVLPETDDDMGGRILKRQTRYQVLMDIVKAAESPKKPLRR